MLVPQPLKKIKAEFPNERLPYQSPPSPTPESITSACFTSPIVALKQAEALVERDAVMGVEQFACCGGALNKIWYDIDKNCGEAEKELRK